MPVNSTEKNEATIASYDADLYALPSDDADIVMKGGITSGVVYPLTVCELARTYRFRSVGGSSAGAIAAAFAAAAEHARDTGGFRRLAALPAKLGGDLGAMFQPSRRTRPLFEVFRAFQDKRHAGPFKTVRLVRYSLTRQPLFSALGAALTALVVTWSLMFAAGTPASGEDWQRIARLLAPAAPLILVGALLGSALGAVRTATRVLPGNGHGLCIGSNGTAKAGKGTLPFTDWLHAELAHVSGKGVLTFGDLWGPTATATFREEDKDTKSSRDDVMRAFEPDVRLEMMTTNVTQRRPVRLPFIERIYMFCDDELREWFPDDVLQALCAGELATRDDGTQVKCPLHRRALRYLPSPPDLPVLVAVRMSLSFPGFISAVPLWVVDYNRTPVTTVRCWFSDGGISSNFPIHFFDSLLPRRRTFAISLGPYPPDHKDSHVYYRDPSLPPGGARTIPTETLGAFAAGVLDTLQNWSDVAQSQIEGYRDRIVEVRLRPEEGGMNIDMPRDTILDLAARGSTAAKAITRTVGGYDFDRQRKKRFRTAMAELQVSVTKMAEHWTEVPRQGATYATLVAGDFPTAVARAETLFAFAPPASPPLPDFTSEPPRPRPELRIVARF